MFLIVAFIVALGGGTIAYSRRYRATRPKYRDAPRQRKLFRIQSIQPQQHPQIMIRPTEGLARWAGEYHPGQGS